jgi:isopentenyl phosphate kinase
MDRSLFLQSLEILLGSGSFSHTTTSSYHQQANGKSEASVKIVKRMHRKCKDSEEDFWRALLFQRNTPNQIGTSPNGRVFGRVTHGMISINEQNV